MNYQIIAKTQVPRLKPNGCRDQRRIVPAPRIPFCGRPSFAPGLLSWRRLRAAGGLIWLDAEGKAVPFGRRRHGRP